MSVRRDRPRHMTIFPGGGIIGASEITTEAGDFDDIARDGVSTRWFAFVGHEVIE